jgi:predicted nucleic acid-binding protein
VTKYVLDSHLYVQAYRSEAAAEELAQFYATFTPATYLSSVVLHELLVGATSQARGQEILRNLAQPFQRTGRVVTPSAQAWQMAGEAIAQMARREKRELRGMPKSLVNDFILAASCREAGLTLVTGNAKDFALINRYIKLSYTAPWPA